MKTVEMISLSLNAITLLIPIFFSMNIIFSLRYEERNMDETNKAPNLIYNILFVIALSIIFNSKKIMKLGTF